MSDNPNIESRIGHAHAAEPTAVTALPVDAIVERFGGIRPMAAKLDIPVTTVQGWKERLAIPQRRWPELVAAAARHGISLERDPPAESAFMPRVAAAESPRQGAPGQPDRHARDRGPVASAASPAAAQAPRRGRAVAILSLAVAAIATSYVAFGARLGLPHWRALLPGPLSDQFLASPATNPPPIRAAPEAAPALRLPTSDPALAERLAALEARVSSSDAATIAVLKAENQRLTQELEQARAKLSTLEGERARLGEARERARQLVVAWGHLRAALATAAPYAPALELFEATADDAALRAAVGPLRERAAMGVPTRPMLAQRFDAMAPEVMRAGVSAGEGFWADLGRRLSVLVVVRRTGARAPAAGTEAQLARAEVALARGDLAGAVGALAALEGGAEVPAREWLDQARGRVVAEQAQDALDRRLLAVIASGEGAKRP